MDVTVTERTMDGVEVVEVRGEVDVHSAPELLARLTRVLDARHPVLVLDLGWLSFIDSTGLGALVAAHNHALGTGTALRLACKSDRILKIFRITGLYEVFDFYPTVAQAIEAGTAG